MSAIRTRLPIPLKGKGVGLEYYDLPGFMLNGDIHVGMAMRVARFRDPDGNIIAALMPATTCAPDVWKTGFD